MAQEASPVASSPSSLSSSSSSSSILSDDATPIVIDAAEWKALVVSALADKDKAKEIANEKWNALEAQVLAHAGYAQNKTLPWFIREEAIPNMGQGLIVTRELKAGTILCMDSIDDPLRLNKCNDLDMQPERLSMFQAEDVAATFESLYPQRPEDAKRLNIKAVFGPMSLRRVCYVASRDLCAGEQLSNFYGPFFWMERFVYGWAKEGVALLTDHLVLLREKKEVQKEKEEWARRMGLCGKWMQSQLEMHNVMVGVSKLRGFKPPTEGFSISGLLGQVEQLSRMAHRCAVCGQSAALSCTACQRVLFCASAHEKQFWRFHMFSHSGHQ